MARPPSETTAHLRRRIVAGATRAFADHGFGGASVQRIADEVGIGKTLVLYHYASKEALRSAVFDQITDLWKALVEALPTRLGSGGDVGGILLDETVTALRAEPDLTRFLLRELLDRDSRVLTELRDRVVPFMTAAAEARPAGRDRLAELVVAGLLLTTVFALFQTGSDGRTTGPAGADDLGERVIAAALSSVRRTLTTS